MPKHKRSGLYAITEKEISDLCECIKLERISPWRALAYGKALDIKNYYGKRIQCQGIKFEGSPRTVFLGGYIEPFLKDAIHKVLLHAAEKCRDYQLKPEQPIQETAMLLRDRLVFPVYRYMIQTDRFLRGSKRKEVLWEDIRYKMEKMDKYIKEQREAAIILAKEMTKTDWSGKIIEKASKGISDSFLGK